MNTLHICTVTSGQRMNFLQLFGGVLGKDPRPTRFYNLLYELGHVDVCAYSAVPSMKPTEGFLPLPQRSRGVYSKMVRAVGLLAHRYETDIWTPEMRALFATIAHKQYSAIVCHDALLLPVALAVKASRSDTTRQCPVIMDAREFYPRQFEHRPLWRPFLGGLNDYVCRTYLSQADIVFTVSPGLADGYKKEYGVTCERLPSFADYQDIRPHATGRLLRCIHHGGAMPGRHLEGMIEAFALLQGKASLDMMLVPNNPRYLQKLQKMAADIPNVTFVPPVPMAEIVPHIAQYDMGVYLLNADSFNHRHALPNKLFEYVQARLAVAVSPVPDMAGLVQKYDIGVIARDFSPQAFAASIKSLAPDEVARYKDNANRTASILCWEQNDALIREKLFTLME